jgi:hypothetical protein
MAWVGFSIITTVVITEADSGYQISFMRYLISCVAGEKLGVSNLEKSTTSCMATLLLLRRGASGGAKTSGGLLGTEINWRTA